MREDATSVNESRKISKAMLYCLKRADGNAELVAFFHILDRDIE
jgi:hypothetical protein